ncbi:hypothetical protein Tco_0063498, partial [Tanacetum coccineum]
MCEGSTIPTDPQHIPIFIQPSPQLQKTQQPRKLRKDTQVTQSSDLIENVRFENVHKHSNDSLLAGGNTLRCNKDILKLDELMALCTTLQNRVLDLEKTKTTQHNEIASLKRRVKKHEKKDKTRTHRLKRLYNIGLNVRVESFDNEESLEQDVDKEVVEVINTTKLIIDAAEDSAASDIVSVASSATTVSAAITNTATIKTVDDITLAQALEEMKSTTPKKKGVVIEEL